MDNLKKNYLLVVSPLIIGITVKLFLVGLTSFMLVTIQTLIAYTLVLVAYLILKRILPKIIKKGIVVKSLVIAAALVLIMYFDVVGVLGMAFSLYFYEKR